MKKYWTEDFEKVRQMAKAERKLLVLEYDACIDADSVSAMTPEEFAEAKADYDKRSIQGGWIHLSADYTSPIAELEFELKKMENKQVTSIDFTVDGENYHIWGVCREKFFLQHETEEPRTWYETGSFYMAKVWEDCGEGTTAEIIEAIKAKYNEHDLDEMEVNAEFDNKVLEFSYNQVCEEQEARKKSA